PVTGGWAPRCVRRIRLRESGAVPLWADLGYLGWLAVVCLWRTRTVGSLPIVVRQGAVVLPSLGAARLADHDVTALGMARIDASGVLELELDSEILHIPFGSAPIHPRWVVAHMVP